MPAMIPSNALGDHVLAAEAFYRVLAAASDGILDMGAVRFVRPYALVALVCAARQHHRQTGQMLQLVRVPPRVHQYLERVDLFKHTEGVLLVDQPLTAFFDRTQPYPKLLELTPVRGTSDMITVITQAERIFSYWLGTRNLRRLLSVLSELCANAYQHSGDAGGVVMIQTHEATSRDQVRVRLAIGDLGVGVRGSLQGRFGPLATDTLGYLREAMNGRTARHTGRGGLGLRVVQQAVGEGGGYLWVRSEDAGVLSAGLGENTGYDGLAYVPGTQVAVDFHAPLR